MWNRGLFPTGTNYVAPPGPPKPPPPGPPPWTPSSVGGLLLWLEADAITGLNDGDPVATWLDQSGNENHATQSTEASKPLFKTNILNGKPVVRFDGSDDALSYPSQMSGHTTITVFVVFIPRRMSNEQTVVSGYGREVFTFQLHGSGAIGSLVYVNGVILYNAWNEPYFTLNSPAVLVQQKTSSALVFRRNATLVRSDATSSALDTCATEVLGATGDTGTKPAQIDIAEFLLYDNDIGDTAVAQVETYLNAKYAVY